MHVRNAITFLKSSGSKVMKRTTTANILCIENRLKKQQARGIINVNIQKINYCNQSSFMTFCMQNQKQSFFRIKYTSTAIIALTVK